MATIDSEVFRFVNVRAPGLIVNTSTTPISPTVTISIARALVKPSVLPVEDWDNLLIEKLIQAKNLTENEGNEHAVMTTILNDFAIPKVLSNNIYAFNPNVQRVVDFANWIDENSMALDKSMLRDKIIALYNTLKSEDEPNIEISTYNEMIDSLNFVETELNLWDVLTASTLRFVGYGLPETISRLLRLMNLGKSLKIYDDFPTDSADIYKLFNSPIFLPDQIFPFPEAPVNEIDEVPATDPRDILLTEAKNEHRKWRAVQLTLSFLQEQAREKQRELSSGFVITYDQEGYPTNFEDMPIVEQDFLTVELMNDLSQRCATTINDELKAGKLLLDEQYFCNDSSRYSYDYIEKEVIFNLNRLQQRIIKLTPYKVKKAILVNGTVMTFEEERRGSL